MKINKRELEKLLQNAIDKKLDDIEKQVTNEAKSFARKWYLKNKSLVDDLTVNEFVHLVVRNTKFNRKNDKLMFNYKISGREFEEMFIGEYTKHINDFINKKYK